MKRVPVRADAPPGALLWLAPETVPTLFFVGLEFLFSYCFFGGCMRLGHHILPRTAVAGATLCVVTMLALGLTPAQVLAQGGESVTKNNESTVPPPIVPPEASFVETPGHKVSFNSDGTVSSSTNENDGVTVDADGSVYADNGSQCTKGQSVRVRECRRNGPGFYLYVDVEYQLYTCGGKKG